MTRAQTPLLLAALLAKLTLACGDLGDPIVLNMPDAQEDASAPDDLAPDLPENTPDLSPDLTSDLRPDDGDASPPDLDPGDMGADTNTFTGRLAPGREVAAGQFVTSQACADCHSVSPGAQAMRDTFNDSVAPYDLWSASMMGLSSRDPFWRAQVSAEIASTPSQGAFIEGICMHCHAPMADLHARANSQRATASTLDGDDDLAQLGLDGISCALCHQISPQNLGTPQSYTGGFVLNDQRVIYGPFEDPWQEPMQERLDYRPEPGEHLNEASMCGACHTVYTPSLSPQGDLLGIQFPEQTTYLEWKNSSYNTGPNAGPKARPCVDCHMPATDAIGATIRTPIARNPDGGDFEQIPERSPVRRHLWFGGNTTMLSLMKQERQQLAPHVPAQAFDRVIAETREHLTTRTGRVEIITSTCQGQQCTLRVRVQHDAGHKFPTGYPSRRAWVRLRIFDSNNNLLFASGDFDSRGRILGANRDVLPTERANNLTQPHHLTITSADQVQIYESIMSDNQGRPTVILMRAARYLKDNRLLPEGYSPNHPDVPSTLSVGVAQDQDFTNRQDITEYNITLPPGAIPARADADLLFQALGARYMDDLFQIQTPELADFARLYDRADLRPFSISQDEATIIR
jgi:hypothetical protein